MRARNVEIFYSDHFHIPLPVEHRFPIWKYGLLRARLLHEGLLDETELKEAPLASRESILRAHDETYTDRFLNGQLTEVEIRRVGFPWSEHLVKKVLASVGGALAAAKHALENEISGNLAGGTHHAHRDWGSGYCVFNDLAVTALELLELKLVRKVAIIDLDVHQGDGNAAILNGNPDVFILNMHCQSNFPFRKVSSTFDVELKDGVEDDEYLRLLRENIHRVFDFGPDIVLYQAGVDPLKEDALGKLNLSHSGLFQRDLFVMSECRKRRIPLSLALGGGYSRPIDATLEAYVGTYRALREVYS